MKKKRSKKSFVGKTRRQNNSVVVTIPHELGLEFYKTYQFHVEVDE